MKYKIICNSKYYQPTLVISSQHREIERLMNIVQDLVTTNLRLAEIIGLKK